MPLDDHEQQILDEIERQLYEADPDLAHAVRNIDRSARFGVRLPAVGTVVGVAIVMFTFTVSVALALVGFLVLVLSANALIQGIAARSAGSDEPAVDDNANRQRIFRRFRRG